MKSTLSRIKLKFREPVNGLTHFIGAVLAVVALIFMIGRLDISFTVWRAVSFSIFGGAMILLYTSSALYHWLPLKGKSLEVFRKIDHIMIFVFIAATYTPVCLGPLRGPWGWSMFGCVWGITIAGFFLKIFWLNAPRFLYTSIYLAMGWTGVAGVWPLVQNLVPPALIWLATGGLFYSVGAVIYALKKPDPRPGLFGFHEIFHVFVMLGSFSHFWMIYHYI